MARAGWSVIVLEKNANPGGRARKLEAEGFTFDMGPSWYWMPDIFERFFRQFGKAPSDYYTLERLSPSYRVAYANNDILDVPATSEGLINMFETLERGSGKRLVKFLK